MRVETPDIYLDLQRKLMTATFRPGQKIKPMELMGAYGCSANTVRDVLLRLSKVGLVEFEIQRGFRVRRATPEVRSDITRFRILLEQEGATQSIRKGGVKWEAALNAAHHALRHIEAQMANASEPESYVTIWSDAELAFHETLISACGSDILRETYGNVYLQFRQQMVSLNRDFGENYFTAIIGEHQAILDAALARDDGACRRAIHRHLNRNISAD